VLVEACVTTVEEAEASVAAGAHRLELCRDLAVGGLTPGAELLAAVTAAVEVPVFAMARPRSGSFVFDAGEVETTVREIEGLLRGGAAGIVVGALHPSGGIDVDAMRRLVAAAGPRPVTFHRAFDELEDPVAAMGALADLKVTRVLTSGGAKRALDAVPRLTELVRRGAGRVGVLAGGGVRGDHVADLVARTGVREVHARAEAIPGLLRALRTG
jgi:copper homeostasis protein